MPKLSTPAKKRLVVSALDDIKARDILAIDVHKLSSAFDWVVIATAESARQTKALARHVKDKLRAAGSTVIGMEGEDSGEWILVDAGDVVAHILQPAVRTYYNLEELFIEGKSEPLVNPTVPFAEKEKAWEAEAKPARKAPAKKKPAVKKKAAAKKPAAKKKPATTKKKPAAKARRKAAR